MSIIPPDLVKPTFRITIEALPGGSPAINRLRMALKSLLRAFGLRCLRCEDITPVAAPDPPIPAASRSDVPRGGDDAA